MVVDHINNDKTDNRLENLQILSPGDNIWKGKERNTKSMKCDLTKPRSFYEEKLQQYLDLYKEAKKEQDKEKAHKYRSYIAQYRARLRYYDEKIN